MQNESYPPPPPLPPRQKSSSRGPLPFVLIGCGGFLVLCALMAAVLGGVFYFGGKSVEPAVDHYFEQANAGAYSQIYAESDAQLKGVSSEAQFVQLLTGVHDTLGRYQSKSMRGMNVNSNNGVSMANATYLVHFEKGDATVSFVLVGSGEVWKLVGVNYNSPQLQAALKCPSCGAELREFAKFCPNCGKALQAEASDRGGP